VRAAGSSPRALRVLAVAFAMALPGCEATLPVTQSYIDAQAPTGAGGKLEVRLEPCVDRTATNGRNLGAEATKAFREKIPSTALIALKDDARFGIACEVTAFAEGSAFQRWLMPGTGVTAGQVAAMVTDVKTGEIVAIARSRATVGGGGLFSAGADDYILAAAVQDVVNQLQAWVGRRGSPGDIREETKK
jgi:hypothetical protein